MANRFIWFGKWIADRRVYRTLNAEMQMSNRSISRLFKKFLEQAPQIPLKSKGLVHLLIDATYLPNGLCLILYYDHDIRYVQLYRTSNQEKFREIYQDLKGLRSLGVQIYSVTCDGHKSILKAVAKAYPQAVIQRCVVHVKRQCRAYLSSRPKLQASQQLLIISNQITTIKTQEKCSFWLLQLHNWYQAHKETLLEESFNSVKNDYWYTHKGLHQAYTLIINALPHLFNYLNDPEIPATTNRLESFFKHLKEKLLLHSGLRLEAKRNFIKWYLHFKNNPLQ
ncbi:MAG: transposase [Bacteroidota bacterium]|nr:transposase [Bacteroidota bacterium]